MPTPFSLEVLSSQLCGSNTAYEKFAKDKNDCRKCSIFNHYQQVVQSEGCIENPIFMFVGEAPGADEIEQGKPFVGQAGQRIRQELRKYPEIFNKETTIISNVIPCRPLNNKFPSDKEMISNCRDSWLAQEIQIVKPRILVTLGGTPLYYLLGLEGITNCRGSWKKLCFAGHSMWAFSTYHPSYVIRCERAKDTLKVKQFEEDIAQIVKEYQTKLDA
jgi:DNA polymerase